MGLYEFFAADAAGVDDSTCQGAAVVETFPRVVR